MNKKVFEKKKFTQSEVDSLTVELSLRASATLAAEKANHARYRESALAQLVSLRKNLAELQGDYNNLYVRYNALKETQDV